MTQVPPTTSRAMGNPTDSDDEPTCPEVITSGDREGEVCGRELPCRFHSDSDGDRDE